MVVVVKVTVTGCEVLHFTAETPATAREEAGVVVTAEWFTRKAVVSCGISVLFTVTENSSEEEKIKGKKPRC